MTIYFMQTSRFIKIGFTGGDPKKRLKQLQTGQPGSIVLLGSIPGTRADEASLHQELKKFRARGEWFLNDETLVSGIKFLIENQHPWWMIRKNVILFKEFKDDRKDMTRMRFVAKKAKERADRYFAIHGQMPPWYKGVSDDHAEKISDMISRLKKSKRHFKG